MLGDPITDEEAMTTIYQIMDGEEWDSDTTAAVAYIIELTGREIHEPGFYEKEEEV